jgi:hypothetical protein
VQEHDLQDGERGGGQAQEGHRGQIGPIHAALSAGIKDDKQ